MDLIDPEREINMEYKTIDTAPENVVVMTKISDELGERNEQPLKRSGKL